jgi:acetyl esterase/lipase
LFHALVHYPPLQRTTRKVISLTRRQLVTQTLSATALPLATLASQAAESLAAAPPPIEAFFEEVTQWLDTDAKALQARVDTLLPNTANRIQLPRRGPSPHLLVQSFADKQPWITLLYQRETGKLTRVGVSHPAIKPQQMGQADFIRYKARDGPDIPAYISLPAGGAGKNLPLVVLVHGGPWVRGFSWQWDAEVQFLASRGYAVLQPEFRGSTGFGAASAQFASNGP